MPGAKLYSTKCLLVVHFIINLKSLCFILARKYFGKGCQIAAIWRTWLPFNEICGYIEAHNHVENAQELHFCLGTAALKRRSKIGEKGKTKRKALCFPPISTSIRQAESPRILLEINTPALSWSAHAFRFSFLLLKISHETLSAREMSGIYYCDTSHGPQSVWQNTTEKIIQEIRTSLKVLLQPPKQGLHPQKPKIFLAWSLQLTVTLTYFEGLKNHNVDFGKEIKEPMSKIVRPELLMISSWVNYP